MISGAIVAGLICLVNAKGVSVVTRMDMERPLMCSVNTPPAYTPQSSAVAGAQRARPEPFTVITRRATLVNRQTSRIPERFYVDDTPFERLPQDLQDVAAALRQFIQAAHAVEREGHLARPCTWPPPISPTPETG